MTVAPKLKLFRLLLIRAASPSFVHS